MEGGSPCGRVCACTTLIRMSTLPQKSWNGMWIQASTAPGRAGPLLTPWAGRRRPPARQPDGDDRLLTGPRGGGSTAHVHRQRWHVDNVLRWSSLKPDTKRKLLWDNATRFYKQT